MITLRCVGTQKKKAIVLWLYGWDITLLEPIAGVFGISISELLSGSAITNINVSANMLRSKYYVCPFCGNVIHSMGEMAVSSHGVQMIKLYPEGSSDTRLKIRGVKRIYCFCNRDGLFYIDVNKYIDGRDRSYDDVEERRELERIADKLFG